MEYFQDVVSSLCDDDVNVLGVLSQHGAVSVYNSMPTNDVFERSELSEAMYRRTVQRLIGTRFIQTVTLKRRHGVFITNWGKDALKMPTATANKVAPKLLISTSVNLKPSFDNIISISRDEVLSMIQV